MELKYIQKITQDLSLSIKQVSSVHELRDQGATIPFMARYRKEATGNMDEVQIGKVIESINYFSELEKRKETVLKTIEAAGKLTPELKKRIEDCLQHHYTILLPQKILTEMKLLLLSFVYL